VKQSRHFGIERGLARRERAVKVVDDEFASLRQSCFQQGYRAARPKDAGSDRRREQQDVALAGGIAASVVLDSPAPSIQTSTRGGLRRRR